MNEAVSRKLTTILAADVEGYCRLMALDEADTMDRLMATRERLAALVTRHFGRIANTAGDGVIAEFPSVVEAVRCAIEIQSELGAINADLPPERAMRLRVGVHLGDVMTDGVDLFGEGVNLAARLEQMADAGDVFISQPVYDQIHRKLHVTYDFMGMKQAHNLPEPVAVYRVSPGDRMAPRAAGPPRARLEAVEARPQTERKAPDSEPRARVKRVAIYAGTTAACLTAIDLGTEGRAWWPYPAVIAAAVVLVIAARAFIEDQALRGAAQAGAIVAAIVALKMASELIP
ncbi:MAG: adenylate/guanylate cyclase domain-containing protein [Pseudomonadota bacterium]